MIRDFVGVYRVAASPDAYEAVGNECHILFLCMLYFFEFSFVPED